MRRVKEEMRALRSEQVSLNVCGQAGTPGQIRPPEATIKYFSFELPSIMLDFLGCIYDHQFQNEIRTAMGHVMIG